MNPSAYKARYTNMKVFLENGNSKTVRVERYLLRSMNYKSTGNDEFMRKLRAHGMDMTLRIDTGNGIDVVDRTLNDREQKIRKKLHEKVTYSQERPGDVNAITTLDDRIVTDDKGRKTGKEVYGERDWGAMAHYAFVGKGSPETCQMVLQLAHHWGLATEEGLPAYADQWLGLDCNGFVGNYLWHDRAGNPWTDLGVHNWERGPDAVISGYFDGKRRLRSWDEIDPGTTYIMGKCDGHGHIIDGGKGVDTAGHIVITEPNKAVGRPGGKAPLSLGTVESTFGHMPEGLTENMYTYKSVKGTVFTLDRGTHMKPLHQEIDMVIAPLTV